MLTAKITSGATTRYFKDELVQFGYTIRSNEATTFSASVPSVIATLTILSADSFMKSLSSSSTVDVYEEDAYQAAGLTLKFYVKEATVLARKGVTELTLDPVARRKTTDILGSLTLPAMTDADWPKISSMYGLSDVFTSSAKVRTQTPTKLVAESKDDIVMALAWNTKALPVVCPTPFSSSGTYYRGPGIAVFEDVKPQDYLQGGPVYQVDPDDIISYNVMPGQPSPSKILSRSYGVQQLTNKVEESPETKAIADTRRILVDKDDSLVAVAYEEAGSSKVYISDGSVAQVSGTAIGLTPSSILTLSSADTIVLRNRSDDSITSIPCTAASAARNIEIWHTIRLLMSDGWHYYILPQYACVSSVAGSSFVGVHISPTNTINEMYMDLVVVSGRDRELVPSNSLRQGYLGTDVSMVAIAPALGYADRTVHIIVLAEENKTGSNLSAIPEGTTTGTGFVMTDFMMGYPSIDGPMYFMWGEPTASPESNPKTFIEYMDSSPITLLAQSYETGSGGIWCYAREGMPAYQSSPIMSVKHTPAGEWQWLLGVVDEPTQSIKWIQSDTVTASMPSYLGDPDDYRIRLYHGLAVASSFSYDPDHIVKTVAATGPAPLMPRATGDFTVVTELDRGPESAVYFGFKVGPVLSLSSGNVDKSLGRLEIELSRFKCIDTGISPAERLISSVQDLSIMAVGAYLLVQLDSKDSGYQLAKVTGFSLSYSGVIRATVYATVVKDSYFLY